MKALLTRVEPTKINPHEVAKADVRKASEYVLYPPKSDGKSEIFASFEQSLVNPFGGGLPFTRAYGERPCNRGPKTVGDKE